jgi:hypothetical protein
MDRGRRHDCNYRSVVAQSYEPSTRISCQGDCVLCEGWMEVVLLMLTRLEENLEKAQG